MAVKTERERERERERDCLFDIVGWEIVRASSLKKKSHFKNLQRFSVGGL